MNEQLKRSTTVLAGDVGGTKTHIALFVEHGKQWVQLADERYESRAFSSLGAIISDFLDQYKEVPKSAVFGVPGPVKDGMARTTNLPWTISEAKLTLPLPRTTIRLVNDLEATAQALPNLDKEEITTLYKGSTVLDKLADRYVVLAPGTGLGQSFLVRQGSNYRAYPSEGGHVGFAPASELEEALHHFLAKKFGRVSYERVISGLGLPNLFDFFVESQEMVPRHETLKKMCGKSKGKVITEIALARKDPVCEAALDMFVAILGSHAGNLALTFMPDGGIFLGGGIPSKILQALKKNTFKRRYLNTGRLRTFVEHIPLRVIMNNRAALKGAAIMAQQLEYGQPTYPSAYSSPMASTLQASHLKNE